MGAYVTKTKPFMILAVLRRRVRFPKADQILHTQRCKQFATAFASTQVVVLPWRYDAEMDTDNSLHASLIKRMISNCYMTIFILRTGLHFAYTHRRKVE